MNNDSFSWQRVRLVARYYYPNLKYQILAYPLLGITLAVISYLLMSYVWGFIFYSLTDLVMSALLAFAPLIFIRRSNRIIETMLPATGAEKSVFIIGYCIVFIPIILYFLSWGITQLLQSIFGVPEFAQTINKVTELFSTGSNSGLLLLKNSTTLVTSAATCMFAVFALRRHRYVAIAWTILPSVVFGVIAFIWGLYMALDAHFIKEMAAQGATAGMSETETAEMLCDFLLPEIWGTAIVSAIYVITIVWLTVKKISHIQL